ncbi:MAG: TIM barrel protein [Saprospiraceae bacterium]|nr:TIM barrel protein [Saprospiraceae bacterium]
MRRRQFLQSAPAALALPLLNRNLDASDPQVFHFHAEPGFSLKIMATNWGFQGTPDAFCHKAKSAGYDGVEIWTPQTEQDRDGWMNAFSKHGLEYGFLAGSWESDFDKHLSVFQSVLDKAVALKPLYINCHSGRDWFPYEQNQLLIEATTAVTLSNGVPVYHETHRGRMLYAAHVTRRFIEDNPALRLTLDISHWCTVHESLLGDQTETVQMALARTDHIHTRVGHSEGPQVNDPRAPEWENALKAHLAWWDKVVEIKAAAGKPLTMLTEFGPPHYLPALPYTQQPVADQWAINVHMKDLLRKRYA